MKIRDKTIKYSPSNYVNFDETSVTPYSGENYSYQVDLADGSSMGRTEKNSKWRFTSVIGIDGLGRMAFKPVVIIRHRHQGLRWNEMKHEKLDGEIQVYDSPAGLYYIQGNAWMNSVIWNDLMLRYNKFLVAQNRNVLLVVDNFAGHKTGIQLSNIELIYFKPNLTSVLQPADLNLTVHNAKPYFSQKRCILSVQK